MLNGQMLHANEIPIEIDLVRKLVATDFPQYREMALEKMAKSGSSNVLFRLGNDLLIRMPRQPGGGSSVEKECRWTPELAPHLSVNVPRIIASGRPGFGYGEVWSIVTWLEGDLPYANSSPNSTDSNQLHLAADLADFVRQLRTIDIPQDAKADVDLRSYRGRALVEYDVQTRINIEQCRDIEGLDVDLDAALAIWESALALPGAKVAASDCWYHGDLVAENLLTNRGHLTGVLDFGGLAIGDPTIDLHGVWELLGPSAREVFRKRLNVEDSEWLRGRAWALAIALGCFTYYWDKMPGRQRDRLEMIRSVLADVAS